MLNHWHALTQFLRVAGAPLDNNICERALKKAILHRRQLALLQDGARRARRRRLHEPHPHRRALRCATRSTTSCALLRHADEVRTAPGEWMPWNYLETRAIDWWLLRSGVVAGLSQKRTFSQRRRSRADRALRAGRKLSRNAVAKVDVADHTGPDVLRHARAEEDRMRIGYASVSTEDQKLHLQRDALGAAGCEKIFEEKMSGTSARLPAREELLEYARRGDVVVVWKLDRLGRSLRDLVDARPPPRPARRRALLAARGDRHNDRSRQAHLSHLRGARRIRGRARARADSRGPRGCALHAAPRSGGLAARSGRARDGAHAASANPKLSARQVAAQLGVHRTTLYRALARSA